MGNVKVLVVSNSVASEGEITAEEFREAQNVLDEPMVLFMDTVSRKCLKIYRIAAKNMDQFKTMCQLKYFETPDLPDGKWEKCFGGYFIGVGPSKEVFKELSKEELVV